MDSCKKAIRKILELPSMIFFVAILISGAEWDAMSEDQKKMVHQMVAKAGGDAHQGEWVMR